MDDISLEASRVGANTAEPDSRSRGASLYYLLFFLSGFPALLYQIVWQRALFTAYGVNIESVTIIVTVFMLGLGLGSLAGGRLSVQPRVRLLLAFGLIEISIGAFGAASLWIFHHVAAFTAGGPAAFTAIIAFALLLVPTLLMGSTLPLLVEHFVQRTRNVGESVGVLYSVNTFGSGIACLCAAFFIMRTLGESGSVRLAAVFNVAVGTSAILLHLWGGAGVRASSAGEDSGHALPSSRLQTIPLWIAVLSAGAVGFISLAYEIVWYRLYAFTSGGAAPCFAMLLGYYLIGIAYGSLAVRDICRKKLKTDLRLTLKTASNVLLFGSIFAFILGPLLARFVRFLPYQPSFVLVFIAAALLGAGFPLLCHAAIGPTHEAGQKLSYLYLSNIVGSALGSFVIGYVVLNFWSTRAVSILLLGLGLLVAVIFAALAHSIRLKSLFACGALFCVVLALLSSYLFSEMYERLLYKTGYHSGMSFRDLVENRSGVIVVSPDEVVYGGGVYDGRFNTDLVHDSNAIFRAYAISGLHAHPKQVLIIGLSSGSWAQVVANDPSIDDITIVEIDGGYLPLIRQRPAVSSLLQNPKVHIVIDDGRRWLVGHPDRKFDFILMNTSFHWRANVSNLLSTDFLRLVRTHLKAGGVHYYNTTSSKAALATGVQEYPYALRVGNFLAVSDSPIRLDESFWREKLTGYKIDGKPVFDLSKPDDQKRMDELMKMVETTDANNSMIESRQHLLEQLKGVRAITDDNMGEEWP